MTKFWNSFDCEVQCEELMNQYEEDFFSGSSFSPFFPEYEDEEDLYENVPF